MKIIGSTAIPILVIGLFYDFYGIILKGKEDYHAKSFYHRSSV